MDLEQPAVFRAFKAGFRWESVVHQPYKQDGAAPFRDISRQVLFHEQTLGCELRYFEMQPSGFSTLERHEHTHAVMIVRGQGECLVGHEVRSVSAFDLITIPSWTWHQFHADADSPLGFLCMVNVLRDRPQVPDEEQLGLLKSVPAVARFLEKR